MHRLLRWLVGPDLFENILGDLEEQARSRWPHSRARLAIWMQIQVAGVIISAIRERTRRSGEGAPMQPLRRGGAMVAGRFLSNRQHDLAFAARLLLKERAFSATAFVTLALCIGANTAMFSIVRSIVLNPLPVPDADRLVVFRNEYPNAGVTRGATSVPDYFDRLALTDAFESFALYQRDGATVGGTHGARRVTLLRATPSFYDMVAAVPALGRGFGADPAGAPGGANEIVLSHAMWTDEFGGVAEAVGQDLRLNGVPFRIVGVMPETFRFLWNDVDVFTSASFSPSDRSDSRRHSNDWEMIARLKPGRSVEQAQEQINALNRRNDERFPEFGQLLRDAGFHTTVRAVQDEVIQDVRPVLLLLWGGVIFVLLIGCLNITNLVLVRTGGRLREMATRQAIGAGLGRLTWQLLMESMLLTAAGGVGGLMLGWWMLELIPALGLDEMPRAHEIRLDAGVVGIVAAATMAIGVFVGLMAVARLWRMDVNRALRDESRSGTASRRTNAVRRSLVTAQVALAFLLLIGAGLLLSSFRAVLLIDPGFRAAGAITGAMNLPVSSYPARAIAPFVDRLLDAVTRVPGVERAGVTTNIPLSDNHSDSVLLAEGRPMTPGESVASPFRVTISADYLQTMGIELVRGRYFDARDTATSTPALIVDERLAERLWPDEDPIGRRAYQPGTPEAAVRPGPETRWLTVVGVVRHVAMEGLASARQSPGTYYFAFAQAPQRAFSIVARSRTDEARTADDIRRVIAEIDPALAFHAVRPMSHYYDRALTPRRVPMVIATAFGGLALLLAALGVYGVLAYTVLERRREIGIRIALGSTAFEVVRLVIRDGVILVTAGLGLGVVAVVAFQRVLGAVLYGVEPLDASVLAAVVALLSLAALVAMIVPARRAATVNPVVVLTD